MNPLRTGLTALGVIIGVAAVVVVVTVMQGVTGQVLDDISALGKNLIVIQPAREHGSRLPVPFKLADGEAIVRDVAGVENLAPVAEGSLAFSANGREYKTQVLATTNAYFDVRDWPFTLGRRFSGEEMRNGAPVCILGATVRRELFGQQNPFGATVRSGTFSCRVIGLLAVKGHSLLTAEDDDAILMPIITYHRRLSGDARVDMLWVSAISDYQIERVGKAISSLLRERRRMAEGEPPNFRVTDIREIVKMFASTAYKLSLAVSGLAAISLLVGGIGIMNVMLVAVTERTREIGIRLAIGATESDVLAQFLIEAVVLALVGGLAGAAIGTSVAAAIAGAIGVPTPWSWSVIAFAFGVPAAIGVAFGFLPALRAARLDPIEALRHE